MSEYVEREKQCSLLTDFSFYILHLIFAVFFRYSLSLKKIHAIKMLLANMAHYKMSYSDLWPNQYLCKILWPKAMSGRKRFISSYRLQLLVEKRQDWIWSRNHEGTVLADLYTHAQLACRAQDHLPKEWFHPQWTGPSHRINSWDNPSPIHAPRPIWSRPFLFQMAVVKVNRDTRYPLYWQCIQSNALHFSISRMEVC